MDKDHDSKKEVENKTPVVPSESGLGESGNKLILRLLGPLADEVGQYLADGFRQWRWRRKNFEKVAERCETEKVARGIEDNSLTAVSEGDAYRLADACSFEDNEIVQELWAGLIISAITPSKKFTMTRACVEILKAIGSVEAGLLLVLDEYDKPPSNFVAKTGFENFSEIQFNQEIDKINQNREKWENELEFLINRMYRHFPNDQREIAIQNLFRLRCIGMRTRRNLDQNTTRQRLPIGVRETETAPTYEMFSKTVDYLEALTLVGSGTGNYKLLSFSSQYHLLKTIPELKFQLTDLGKYLISLCMTQELRRKSKSINSE